MDQDIIELLMSRDQKAIELTAQRYEKLLLYIISSILGDRRELVDECVNDVYLKLWTGGQAYDFRKASFRTYLKAIARNTALNSLRRARRLEELEGGEWEKDTLLDAYIDYSQDVEKRMVYQEEIEVMERVLHKLKKKDQALILRRYFYLESVKQIAAAMKMSENAVNSRLSRLRGKLKRSYEREVQR
ncbi:MAG: sigma-70 family RNA polymerase sigma factor [Clostridiales bacterium]|nr:sigma-70 family RNA polymerase sigma factor [Clostridiales bacterium]MCD8153545.1 sigma-70 family RNA polymerase sigma factor [Clostridiales bacterium]